MLVLDQLGNYLAEELSNGGYPSKNQRKRYRHVHHKLQKNYILANLSCNFCLMVSSCSKLY